jgi:hypothetical protein
MSNSIPYIIILIFLVLIALVLLVGIYFYGFLDNLYKILNITPVNNYEKLVFDDRRGAFSGKDNSSDGSISFIDSKESLKNDVEKISLVDSTKNISAINTDKKSSEILNAKSRFKDNGNFTEKLDKKISSSKNADNGVYGKGSNVKDFDFHSYGEFVSDEEKQYRVTLIKNLKIKTIVVNSVTKGNGISQEYYKIAYMTKMIPAKILDVLVESKEFRELIPAKYRSNEFTTNGFKKGESVQFKNTDVIRLLNDWSLGKLSPVSKAWKVKAEK